MARPKSDELFESDKRRTARQTEGPGQKDLAVSLGLPTRGMVPQVDSVAGKGDACPVLEIPE